MVGVDSTLKRKKDFIMQSVGGENIIIPIGKQVMNLNGLITLNVTAAYAWELLAEDLMIDQLADAVAAYFNIDIATAHLDMQTFLEDISKMGLLEE